MSRNQRIGAYGICHDDSGRILLVRASRTSTVAGRWFLPGGGVEHGEEPLDSLRRELAEETGLTLRSATLRGLLSDLWEVPRGPVLHTVRVLYTIDHWEGEIRPEVRGSSDAVAWVARATVDAMPVMPYVAEALERYG